MKKIWSILLVSVILGMTACSKDDDNTAIPEEMLGKWKLQNMDIATLETSDQDIREIAEEIFEELSKEFYFGETVELYDNGTVVYKGESIKYYVKNNTLTLVDDEGYQMNFSYKASSDKLILTLNMKEMILAEMTGELSKEELNYIKSALKQFTIDFTYVR